MFFPPQPQAGSLSAVITAPTVVSLLRLDRFARIFLFAFLNIRVVVKYQISGPFKSKSPK